jgi:hypothetical protein
LQISKNIIYYMPGLLSLHVKPNIHAYPGEQQLSDPAGAGRQQHFADSLTMQKHHRYGQCFNFSCRTGVLILIHG